MYMSEELVKLMPEMKFSFLIQHGDKDTLTDIEGSKKMQAEAQSTDKTLSVS